MDGAWLRSIVTPSLTVPPETGSDLLNAWICEGLVSIHVYDGEISVGVDPSLDAARVRSVVYDLMLNSNGLPLVKPSSGTLRSAQNLLARFGTI